jgi:protocatechuate 3,4-dioxygenase alpha subunit
MGADRLPQTPWQTVGPFFHYALPWTDSGILTTPETIGARIIITGRVFDADGAVVPDAMVEIWQANAAGRYRHPDDTRADRAVDPAFIGFGRAPTDATGVFRFETIRPGRVPGPGNSLQAPHIAISLLGRGLLKRLATRLYFPDVADNDEDPILALVPHERRHTLIATQIDAHSYGFDIIIQGEGETVFFDV